MKLLLKTVSSLLIIMTAGNTSFVYAQVNRNANPFSLSINATTENLGLGSTAVSIFELGNNGSDPIPAGGAQWNISFPTVVNVDQASLNMDGGSGIFSATWAITSGTTYLTLKVIGAGVPARVLNGPKTKFVMSVNIRGINIGNLQQQAINNSFDAAISQNLDPGDDNASGPITVSATLPLQLQSFTGIKQGGQASLQWQYNSAAEFSYFELERGIDGVHFNNLYSKRYIATANAGTTVKLTEIDVLPASGDNYYRLKMVEKDASFVYSETVKLYFMVTGAYSVYPNPVKDRIDITGVTAGKEIFLYDITGKLLQRQKASGSRIDEVIISGYAKGQYVINVAGLASTTNIKIVKQ